MDQHTGKKCRSPKVTIQMTSRVLDLISYSSMSKFLMGPRAQIERTACSTHNTPSFPNLSQKLLHFTCDLIFVKSVIVNINVQIHYITVITTSLVAAVLQL